MHMTFTWYEFMVANVITIIIVTCICLYAAYRVMDDTLKRLLTDAYI